MFAVIFICGNLFLRIAGKTAKIAKIRIVRTRKNFASHGNFIYIIFGFSLRQHPVFVRSDDRKYVCRSQATSALN